MVSLNDPFKIEGPALVSFSGGRTSGYMLWRILQAHGGTLPDDVKVSFANTGKEMTATLGFVRECGKQWDTNIIWLEYGRGEVNFENASRHGEPFSAMIKAKKFLPNPVARICTINLKLVPMQTYAKSLGWDDYLNVVGLRADEPIRVAKMRGTYAVPLARAGITKADVMAFWKSQPFDLQIAPGDGNCDLCFLKSADQIMSGIRRHPYSADWWINEELERGATFRSDRPSYRELLRTVRTQSTFDFGDEPIIDCFCGDAA